MLQAFGDAEEDFEKLEVEKITNTIKDLEIADDFSLENLHSFFAKVCVLSF